MSSQMPDFLSPLVLPPSAKHTHTLIFLHGRGGTSDSFGPPFFAAFPAYPGLKTIFPTPSKTFSHKHYRDIPQWFSLTHSVPSEEYTDEQLAGLRLSVEYLQQLIAAEVAAGIPANRILLGGFSQGVATAMLALLWGRWKLAGFVGLSGWLPFARELESAGGTESTIGKLEELRVRVMKAEPREREVVAEVLRTPMWLGHGVNDEIVAYEEGRRVEGACVALGMVVVWGGYPDWGHWYKVPEEIDDIVAFWCENCGLQPMLKW